MADKIQLIKINNKNMKKNKEENVYKIRRDIY